MPRNSHCWKLLQDILVSHFKRIASFKYKAPSLNLVCYLATSIFMDLKKDLLMKKHQQEFMIKHKKSGTTQNYKSLHKKTSIINKYNQDCLILPHTVYNGLPLQLKHNGSSSTNNTNFWKTNYSSPTTPSSMP